MSCIFPVKKSAIYPPNVLIVVKIKIDCCPKISNFAEKRKRGKNKVKITSYIDGPFFVNKDLETKQEQKKDLRNRVYNQMVERSKNSNFEFIKYEYKDKK